MNIMNYDIRWKAIKRTKWREIATEPKQHNNYYNKKNKSEICSLILDLILDNLWFSALIKFIQINKV